MQLYSSLKVVEYRCYFFASVGNFCKNTPNLWVGYSSLCLGHRFACRYTRIVFPGIIRQLIFYKNFYKSVSSIVFSYIYKTGIEVSYSFVFYIQSFDKSMNYKVSLYSYCLVRINRLVISFKLIGLQYSCPYSLCGCLSNRSVITLKYSTGFVFQEQSSCYKLLGIFYNCVCLFSGTGVCVFTGRSLMNEIMYRWLEQIYRTFGQLFVLSIGLSVCCPC